MHRHLPVLISFLAARCVAEVQVNKPFQVVQPTANHSSMVPVSKGLQMLMQHDAKISVVSVVGPYHSGKSFLLNALAGDTSVFQIGRRTSPETMGIWMCRTDLKASDGSEVWLMDSEGFFGPGVSESYDAKIFTIASLLGGHLVYNTVKIIDQQAVSLLEMLARRAQLFRTRSSAESASAEAPEFLSVRTFPPLTWVVEDFVQELPEQHKGVRDGATAWLRSYLSKVNTSSGYQSDDEHFLSRLYSDLKVHTLFLPATSKKHLQDLSSVRWDELTNEFKGELADLKKHILSRLEARKFEGRSMRGPTLERALRFIVQALQRGMFHELPSLWATWTTQVADMSMQDAETWFASLLTGVDHGDDPVPVSTFNSKVEESREKTVEFYRELLRDFDVQPDIAGLRDRMGNHFQQKLTLYHERILRWVGQLAGHAKDSISRALGAVELPVDPDILRRHGENITRTAVQDFSETLQVFAQKGSPVTLGRAAQMPVFTQDPVSQLTSDLRAILGSRELENEREIAQFFKAAVAAAAEAVDNELKLNTGKLLGKARMKEMQGMVAVKCWQAFDEKLAKHRWMMTLAHYKTHKALVQTETYDARMARFAAGNEQKLTAHFRTAVERCTSSYRARKANLAMPVSEEDLVAEHRQLATSIRELLDEQAGQSGDLKDTDNYRQAVRNLNAAMEEGSLQAARKNVELWKVHSDEATSCAVRENDAVMRHCGLLCLFNKVPQVHKSMSQKHLIQCFARSGTASRMSPAMQKQVFENWYSKDLAHDATTVWHTFYMNSAAVGLLILVLCLACNRRPAQAPYGGYGKPLGQPEVGRRFPGDGLYSGMRG